MNDARDRKVQKAEGDTKIFNNRTKYIVFFLTLTTGVLTIWEKCGSSSHQPASQVTVVPLDSVAQGQATSPHRKVPASHRHQSGTPSTTKQGGSNPDDKVLEHAKDPGRGEESAALPVTKPVTLTAPLERAELDDIEFRLMRAEGSIRGQTIKMTVVLITSAANWAIQQDIQSIIDGEGNEYRLKSFTDGASDIDTRIALNTGVPIRCTFTFGGVLPTVGTIKLFKFQYWDKIPGKRTGVEFRDIPIQWK